MDKLINKMIDIDLTGTDIDMLTKGKAILMLYKDLLNYNSIFSAFQGYPNIILLFPVQSDVQGHFVCIQRNDKLKVISHFDSYGISWVQEMGYTDNQYVKRNLLGEMYQQAQQQGWTITYNKYQLQSWKTGTATCGRHSCMRARFDFLDNDEYAKLFMRQKETPDFLVTIMTFIALDEEVQDEETVIRSLGLNK